MENFFNGVLAETWSWTNTIVGGDYVLIFCFWCKITSNKSAHTITIPTSTNFDFYIDCFISPVYTISVIMLFLNQYEYLSNFYYLTCFKPIDTSLRYLFHKNEKKNRWNCWLLLQTHRYRHLFYTNGKISGKIAGYWYFFTELLKWRISFVYQSGRALHMKILSKLIKIHYLHWVFL